MTETPHPITYVDSVRLLATHDPMTHRISVNLCQSQVCNSSLSLVRARSFTFWSQYTYLRESNLYSQIFIWVLDIELRPVPNLLDQEIHGSYPGWNTVFATSRLPVPPLSEPYSTSKQQSLRLRLTALQITVHPNRPWFTTVPYNALEHLTHTLAVSFDAPSGSSPGLKAKGLTSLWPGRCTGGTDYSLIIQKPENFTVLKPFHFKTRKKI